MPGFRKHLVLHPTHRTLHPFQLSHAEPKYFTVFSVNIWAKLVIWRGSNLFGVSGFEECSNCARISALLEGLNYLAAMRNPMDLPPPPMLLDPMGPPDQRLIDEPRTEAATDQRSELSRLLESSSSNLFEKPSSDLFESGSSSNLLESVDEDEGVVAEKKPSKGPSLWRFCL